MKNILKSLFFKLSYNLKMRKFANKIFVYFPKLKSKLVELRDSSYTQPNEEKPRYTSDFLDTIKKEIEDKKSVGQ
ncbi:MAG: hypothetical protein U9N33_08700 [Campylobacterota bacterium]|nr:hypothetical protein [Campylobacterota bacterium]